MKCFSLIVAALATRSFSAAVPEDAIQEKETSVSEAQALPQLAVPVDASSPTRRLGSCTGVYPYNTPEQATWCENNCYHDPPNCPSSYCYCGPPDPPPYTPPYLSCTGVYPYNTPEQATWCDKNCNHPGSRHCPSSHCDCTTASHVWDFRDCETGNNVADTGVIGGTTASPVNVSTGCFGGGDVGIQFLTRAASFLEPYVLQ